jgi:hypothetical protein
LLSNLKRIMISLRKTFKLKPKGNYLWDGPEQLGSAGAGRHQEERKYPA